MILSLYDNAVGGSISAVWQLIRERHVRESRDYMILSLYDTDTVEIII